LAVASNAKRCAAPGVDGISGQHPGATPCSLRTMSAAACCSAAGLMPRIICVPEGPRSPPPAQQHIGVALPLPARSPPYPMSSGLRADSAALRHHSVMVTRSSKRADKRISLARAAAVMEDPSVPHGLHTGPTQLLAQRNPWMGHNEPLNACDCLPEYLRMPCAHTVAD